MMPNLSIFLGLVVLCNIARATSPNEHDDLQDNITDEEIFFGDDPSKNDWVDYTDMINFDATNTKTQLTKNYEANINKLKAKFEKCHLEKNNLQSEIKLLKGEHDGNKLPSQLPYIKRYINFIRNLLNFQVSAISDI